MPTFRHAYLPNIPYSLSHAQPLSLVYNLWWGFCLYTCLPGQACRPAYLHTCLYTCLFAYLPTCLPTFPTFLYSLFHTQSLSLLQFKWGFCLYNCLTTYLPIYLPICLPADLPTCLPSYLPIDLHTYFSIFSLPYTVKRHSREKIIQLYFLTIQ